MKLNQAAVKIVQELEAKGYEAYVVGGAVRDMLLSRESKDWDVTTNATPEQVLPLFTESFYDNAFGTVMVAGKHLKAQFELPVVISVGQEVSKGSARSIGSINITEILRAHKEMLLGVGGHVLAAGFSIETKNIPAFKKALYQYADANVKESELVKEISVEGEIRLSQITKTLAKLILTLEPFGMGNYKPRFVVRDLQVLEDRVIGKNGNHRKLVVEQDGVTRDVIWFNGEAKHPLQSIKAMVFTAEINVWRDRESVQLNAQYVETD